MDSNVGMFAFYSRMLVLITQVVFNQLLPDHNPDVFNPPESYKIKTIADTIVEKLLGGLKRWDGLYFMHIAEHGYTYENCVAFFPLFPFTVKFLGNTLFFPLQYIMNMNNVLLLSAVVLNVYCFVQAAKALNELGKELTGNNILAYKAAILFCVNPASVFFTAPYSESMFAMLLFKGLVQCGNKSRLKASVYFGLATLTRSNGIVTIGFILYFKLKDVTTSLFSIWNNNSMDRKTRYLTYGSLMFFLAVPTVVFIFVIITPFALYQYYIYTEFCNYSASSRDMLPHILKYGRERHYKMPFTGYSKWCYWKLPLSYSYIQNQHWQVGFLEYYEIKQIPNFALAAPMVMLCVLAVYQYALTRWKLCRTLGFFDYTSNDKRTDDAPPRRYVGFFADGCFVHVCYMAFMVVFGLFFMHVQVITRFVSSSCPMVFLYAATVSASDGELVTSDSSDSNKYQIFKKDTHQSSTVPSVDVLDWENKGYNSRLIYIYFMLYLFVGTAAFSNFFPWT